LTPIEHERDPGTASEEERQRSDPDGDADHHAEPAAVPAVPPNYQSVLNGVIEQVRNDPARMRALVYELARLNLKREAFDNFPKLKRAEAERQFDELERAIRRIEANAEEDADRTFAPPALIEPPPPEPARDDAMLIVPDRPPRWLDSRVRVSLGPSDEATTLRERPTIGSRFNAVLQFIGTAAIGIFLFAVLTGQINFTHLFGNAPPPAAPSPPVIAAAPPPQAAAPPATPPEPALPFPMPAAYGVYVVSDGRLYELESLPIKVPDPRIQMSAEIVAPSVTSVPGENLMFVIYRRDLVTSAPARVPVRVVAQVTREMTFKGGTASVSKVEGTWRIRPTAFEFRVMPVPNRPELVMVQPDAGFVMPPGRYVMVLGGMGYDFTVSGSLSPAHCLERFETSSGPMFSECKTP
jgi:hypothetical protein